MIFVDKMRDLKIYKKPLFLPTTKTSKKKNSAIFLLTPNRESSLKLMKSPMTINKLRFESYYIEKDLTYFISSKVLKKDESVDEEYVRYQPAGEYITEALITPELIRNEACKAFKEKIAYSGYKSDVEYVKQIFTPEVYKALYLHDLALMDMDKLPIISITVNSDEGYSYKRIITPDGKLLISFDIYCADHENSDYNIRCILQTIIHGIISAIYPALDNTILPDIFTAYIFDDDTIYGKYAEYLFGDDSDDNNTGVLTKEGFRDICKNTDIKALYEILHKKFPDITMKDIYCDYGDKDIQEVSSVATTIENIDKKFKYATSTKLKRSMSKKVNGVKRLLRGLKEKLDNNSNISFTGFFNTSGGGGNTTINNIKESELSGFTENVDFLRIGDDRVLFLENDMKYDMPLKRILYNDRIKQRKMILAMDKAVKIDDPEIKYAYPDLERYANRNLFIDLYYYNQVFFKNNTLKLKKGFDIYLELIDRLVNDPRITKAGYSKHTIFIPVLDWNNNPETKMWLYRNNLNPISVIYQLMYTQSPLLKKVFKDTNIIFFGDDKYFKMNFSDSTPKDLKKNSILFRTFISKIIAHQEFDSDDIDDSMKQSPEAIKADIYDAIDKTKGVDLTGKEKVKQQKSDVVYNDIKKKDPTPVKGSGTTSSLSSDQAKKIKDIEDNREDKEDENTSKAADKEDKALKQEELDRLASMIDNISKNSNDTSDALDAMDNNEELKNILNDLGTNDVKISTTRSARINTLTTDFLDQNVGNKTVKEILSDNPSDNPVETTSLNIASPNPEWKNMTYMNFDKDYNLNRDILNCFKHFSEVSLPIAVRKLTVTDNSTSEDRLDLYTVEMEDYRGKRFTVKLDIPRMVDNRFLLRGNNKIIETQFLNMPILKTDLDTAQVITNYQKIFIRRFRTSTGKSTSISSRLIKALSNYKGHNLKVEFGDNSRVCNKYQLPIDYIDMSSVLNTITLKNGTIIYFNQDNIRDKYEIDETLGIPYAYNGDTKKVEYYTNTKDSTFAGTLARYLYNKYDDFNEVFNISRPSISGTYSRCSILSTEIPLVVVVGYTVGLSEVIKRVGDSSTRFIEKIDNDTRRNPYIDYIKFKDGYLIYNNDNYANGLLYNGLKDCPCDECTMADMDKKSTYVEFLDNFGGRIKADGLENFNDCLVDPISKEVLEHYNLPTNFVDILLYANTMLADNAFVRHTDTASRRIRRNEMVAAYTYESLSESYALWANQLRHGSNSASFRIKQSTVIDKLLSSQITQDDSVNNALGAVEETNTISFKGKSGLNSDRSYSLDKRTYDDSMTNVLGMSTGFSGNVGITRQATIDMNIDGQRGYIKQTNGDTSKMNTAKTLTATEALVPMCVESDDPQRVAMTFIQTAKHQVRTEDSDPLLVTNGADEAMPYLTTDTFAFKAKKNGKVKEVNDEYMIIDYEDGTSDYISLKEEVKKNSDGGYFVPLQLSAVDKYKIGSSVKANEVLAYDKYSFSTSAGEDNNLKYNTGKLTKVAILCSDEGFEDSGICTEKLAKQLATRVIYKFDRIISKDATIFDEKSVGDIINVGDALLVWQDPYEDKNANIVIKAISDENDKEKISELGRKAIRSDTSGTIVDLKIYRTCELEDMSPTVQKLVKSYEAPIKQLKKKLESDNISNVDLPATYKLEPVGKLKKAEDSILVEYYVEYTDIVGSGDKITLDVANKETIKGIISDKDAPYTEFRPHEQVSSIGSLAGVNARMVTSSIRKGSLQKLMVELDRHVKDMLDIPYDDTQA